MAVGAAGLARPATIPAEYLDLVNGPRVAALTTIMPDGQPQSSLVWCDYDGECACVNTTLERQEGRNLVADPRTTLLLVDPNDKPPSVLWLRVPCQAEHTRDTRALPYPRPEDHARCHSPLALAGFQRYGVGGYSVV